jgi:DMSO/TMAO reductase YedYZ molybdopterin-dependent catalytic subunit
MLSLSRRQLLQLTAGLGLASMMPQPQHSLAGMWSQLFGNPKRDISPITPNDEFYLTSYRTPPFIPAEQWTLTIRGQVNRPFTMTYPQLLAQPTVSEIVTLECVGNGVAGEAIGTAEWEGMRLKHLLDHAGVRAQAYDVIFHAADGYSDSLRVERAMMDDMLMATRMNGVPLPLGHGFPARIIAPGHYGMKHVQWLTGIELVTSDYQGYYQRKGWSDNAIVKTMSWINDPQTGDVLKASSRITIKGCSFAGSRGIRQVELSTDGGTTWELAHLAPALSPYSWVFWTYSWEPSRPGDHRLLARATDGTGTLQTMEHTEPFPDGASGLPETIVSVE